MAMRPAERLVLKFAASLRDNVRLEPQRRANSSSAESRSQRPWICVRVADDFAQQPPPAADARWRSVRAKLEAVSVLSAAASCRALSLRSNPCFWAHLLTTACGLRDATSLLVDDDADDFGGDAPLFLLDFSFMEVTPDLLRLCRTFLCGKRRTKKCLRIRYTSAMSELEALARQQSSRPLRVRVAFVFHRCDLHHRLNTLSGAHTNTARQSSVVQQLEEIVEAVAARAASIRRLLYLAAARAKQRPSEKSDRPRVLDVDPTVWGSFFFEVVSLEFSASELAKQDFARIGRMVADPAGQLRALVLNKVVSSSNLGLREYAAAFGTLMTRCFGVEAAVASGSELSSEVAEPSELVTIPQQITLDRFVFDCNALNLCTLSSLFSAIRSSSQEVQSARELSLVGTFRRFDGDPALPWAWLAFGMFHATSNSRIRSLDLSSNTLCHDDANAMRRVLTMDNAYTELLGLETMYSEKNRVSPSASTWLYCAVRLKKRASMWPTKGESESVLLQLNDESVWFEAFKQGKKWTCVLVPGYGVLWTKTSMILEREDREHLVRQKPPHLKKLLLNSMVGKESEQFSHLLRELLPLVGGTLLHLELCSNPLSSLALSAVVGACPHLRHLDISNCELHTIGAILNGYERDQCRISSLVVSENEIGEQDVRRLCSLLRARPSPRRDRPAPNAAAANLRFLDLDQNPIGRQGLLAIGKVLTINKVLETVVLSRSEDPDSQLRSRFAVHDDEYLGVRPLRMCQKLAVLSVARAIPTLNEVDVPVLQAIFAFSGVQVYRKVVWK